MTRRLYFLFPDVGHTRRAVDGLKAAGIEERHMHAISRKGVDLSTLPAATLEQARDRAYRVEKVLWNANMGVFGIAALGLVWALVAGSALGAVVAVAVMLAAFGAGVLFTNLVPNAHLYEFRHALRHGEVVLMVDVPRERLLEIERLIGRRHPEAVEGGAGWATDALGM